jgi:hypothetical protein
MEEDITHVKLPFPLGSRRRFPLLFLPLLIAAVSQA